MKVKESCCSGSFTKSPLRVRDPDAVGVPTDNHKETQFRSLSEEKFDQMKLVYNQFIPPKRRPDYLPPFVSTVVVRTAPASSSSGTSSSLVRAHITSTSEPPPKRRKQSVCSTTGCDGSGHKNPVQWAHGHTTRAGCPLLED